MKKTTTLIINLLIVSLAPCTIIAESIRFGAIGDYGTNDSRELSVANMVKSWNPDFIVTAGDNSYGSNPIDMSIGQYYGDYIGNYAGAFGTGSITNRFWPTLGNHDYSDGGGINTYLSYFTLPGNERYYDFIVGPVHFFAVNSNYQEPDGNNSASIQATWLQNGLSNSISPWKIVLMHHPPYSSSSKHGSQPVMQWPYEEWGATALITGHDHTYERIIRDGNSDLDSIPYFVNGLGGRFPYGFPSNGFVQGSEVRYNTTNGAMLIEANDSTIAFYFYSVTQGLVDQYLIGKCCQVRGNIDGIPGGIDMVDLVYFVDYMFREGPVPNCLDEADVETDGEVNILDLVRLVDFLYYSETPFAPCF